MCGWKLEAAHRGKNKLWCKRFTDYPTKKNTEKFQQNAYLYCSIMQCDNPDTVIHLLTAFSAVRCLWFKAFFQFWNWFDSIYCFCFLVMHVMHVILSYVQKQISLLTVQDHIHKVYNNPDFMGNVQYDYFNSLKFVLTVFFSGQCII